MIAYLIISTIRLFSGGGSTIFALLRFSGVDCLMDVRFDYFMGRGDTCIGDGGRSLIFLGDWVFISFPREISFFGEGALFGDGGFLLGEAALLGELGFLGEAALFGELGFFGAYGFFLSGDYIANNAALYLA